MSKDGTRIGSLARELELRKEIESLRRDRAELMAALRELLAAGDESCSPSADDVAAMLRFGDADKAARALLARMEAK